MAVNTQHTLVVRGVSVLVKSGLTVPTCRGLGYQGLAEPSAPISMRSPRDANPIANPDQRRFREQDLLAAAAAKRAGRLDGHPMLSRVAVNLGWQHSREPVVRSFGLASSAS
jgi:hypothetical protein